MVLLEWEAKLLVHRVTATCVMWNHGKLGNRIGYELVIETNLLRFEFSSRTRTSIERADLGPASSSGRSIV